MPCELTFVHNIIELTTYTGNHQISKVQLASLVDKVGTNIILNNTLASLCIILG